MSKEEQLRKRVEEHCIKEGYTNLKIIEIYPQVGTSSIDLEYDWNLNGTIHHMDTTWLAFDHLNGNITFEY